MNPFQKMMNDDAYVIDASGLRHGPFKTKFGGETLAFFEENFRADVGDFIVQALPGGQERNHEVIDVDYSSGLRAIPACWTVTVKKVSAAQAASLAAIHNYTINATNVQVGNHNTQHITANLQTLISTINNSDCSPEQKSDAKSKLRTFLESPLMAAVLGGAVQGLLALL
jgi:hypothetical protein